MFNIFQNSKCFTLTTTELWDDFLESLALVVEQQISNLCGNAYFLLGLIIL